MNEKDFMIEGKKPDKDKKKEGYCVELNIYAKCDKKHHDPCHTDKKGKDGNQCVEVNIYAECDK